MVKASRDDVVLAESDKAVMVEGNHYFPPDSVNWEHFKESSHHTVCPWKGMADHYNLEVGGKVVDNAAWIYHDPSDAAQEIKDYVGFYPRSAFIGKVKMEA